MADFQKPNWSRTTAPTHSVVYCPATPSALGITAATVTAGSMQIYSVTAPFQFKGNGQCEVSLPVGATLQTGVALAECYLGPPASGSYSAGNHPVVKFKTQAQIAATIAATSVLITQY